jgi:thiamine pyrophosphate-dependent acetolactate synthase large subunit-like protein
MPTEKNFLDLRHEVAERWRIWRVEKASRRMDFSDVGVNTAAVFDSLSRMVDPDAAIAVDVGNNTYSFGRYFEVERQSLVMSGYLGSIGFAFPAAMGVWAAVGERRQVIAVAGDGGFGQYAMEFTTAVRYEMNITLILLVNDELGKISKEQRGDMYDVWQTGLTNPDFAEFARNCGGFGVRVSTIEGLDDAIAAGLSHVGPSIVQIDTDPLLV